MKPVRVLVVDDSAFMRHALSKALADDPALQVAGTAADGRRALEAVAELSPDVVTLDVNMPGMDGLTVLNEIMARFPRPVVMVSALTSGGAETTVRALALGAVDFTLKPAAPRTAEMYAELRRKVLAAAQVRVAALQPLRESQAGRSAKAYPWRAAPDRGRPRPLSPGDALVVIGASTGGPRALMEVVPRLPAALSAAVLVLQHMPAIFTHSLAGRLHAASALPAREAEAGDRLQAGEVLVAPGGRHLVLRSEASVRLENSAALNGARPSVDRALISAAQEFGARTVAVILTGMGADGRDGAGSVRKAGGRVIVQDEASSVVWGMPRAVAEAGHAEVVAPLANVADEIVKAVESVSEQTRPSSPVGEHS